MSLKIGRQNLISIVGKVFRRFAVPKFSNEQMQTNNFSLQKFIRQKQTFQSSRMFEVLQK